MTDKTTQRFSWSTTGMKVDAEGSFVLQSELTSMTRMFLAACADLGLINEALSLDPEDGGAEPILDAIEELKTKAGVGAEAAQEVTTDVRAAVERMCSPLHESRLSGVTAQEDARCMKLIRDYVLGTAAAPSPGREQVGKASEAARIVKMWDDGFTQLAGKRAVELLRDASPSRECGERQGAALSDAEILKIGYRHFKPGHNVKAEANFVAAVRDILAASAPRLGEKERFDAGERLQCPNCKSAVPGVHTKRCKDAAHNAGAHEPVQLHFGHGELVVQAVKVSEFEFSGIAIYQAAQPGEVGASAKREPSVEDPAVLAKSILLVFPTTEQRDRVEDALVNAQPQPMTDAARDVLAEAGKWLHAAYDRPPRSPECESMLAKIDREIECGEREGEK